MNNTRPVVSNSWKRIAHEEDRSWLSDLWSIAKVRGFVVLYLAALSVVRLLSRTQRDYEPGNCRMLLTGTFYSANWAIAHLRPLGQAKKIKRVHIASAVPIDVVDDIVVHVAPPWMSRCFGEVGARLIMFFYIGWKLKPHVVGGYHMTMNGLAAALLAPMIGARSLYNCCGGPSELVGGGFYTENRLFAQLPKPDLFIEAQLIKILRTFDLIVTRGQDTIDFFKEWDVEAEYHVIAAGVDDTRFKPRDELDDRTDVIFVGRLVAVKRVEILLRAIAAMQEQLPGTSATIMGDGEEKEQLEALTHELGIDEQISFLAHQDNVEHYLRRSRVFVLPSASEGLSIALIEAMLCGLPAVVSDVGNLHELVSQGQNGFLLRSNDHLDFADSLIQLLGDPMVWKQFSNEAHASASRYTLSNMAARWNDMLINPPSRKPNKGE